jgi:putative flippase GtrA
MSSRRQSSHVPTVAGLAREWFMFVLIGGGVAGLYVLLASLLDVVIDLAPAMASAIAYGVLVLPAYAAQRSFTFRSSASHLQSLPRYLAHATDCAFSGLNH